MRVEGCLLGKVEDFALVVSRPLRGAQVGGMRSRHLEMSRLQSKAGSSLALPAVRRARQSSLSAALLSRPCEEAKPLEQRSEEHTSELQSRFGISYAVF